MDVPDQIYFDCRECRDITQHDVLKGRIGKSLEATLRCQGCGRVSVATIKLPRMVTVKVIVSDGPVSGPTAVELESDDLVVVGDEFLLDDGKRVKVTGIDLADGAKAKKAPAPEISVLWVILFDEINIKVSINDVHRTYSKYVKAEPEDEFFVGQVMNFGDMDCVVHSIKVKERMLRRGSAEARDIVRIYGKIRRISYPVLSSKDDAEDV
jgi:uncharacterized Zn finger protein